MQQHDPTFVDRTPNDLNKQLVRKVEGLDQICDVSVVFIVIIDDMCDRSVHRSHERTEDSAIRSTDLLFGQVKLHDDKQSHVHVHAIITLNYCVLIFKLS